MDAATHNLGDSGEPAQSLRKALDFGVRELDLPFDDCMKRFMCPFLIARRIQKILLEFGHDPAQVKPSEFIDLVAEVAEENGDCPVQLPAEFEEVWDRVRVPEGEDPLTHNLRLTEIYDWRIPVPPDLFSRREAQRDAEQLVTTLYYAQMDLPEGEHPYCPTRKYGLLIGRSNDYVAVLIRMLERAEVLERVDRGNTHKAPRFKVRYSPPGTPPNSDR